MLQHRRARSLPLHPTRTPYFVPVPFVATIIPVPHHNQFLRSCCTRHARPLLQQLQLPCPIITIEFPRSCCNRPGGAPFAIPLIPACFHNILKRPMPSASRVPITACPPTSVGTHRHPSCYGACPPVIALTQERFKMLWKRAGMRGIANSGRDDCNKSVGIGYDWAPELEWLLNVATKGACRVQRGRAREQSKARVSGATRESAGMK